MSAFTEAFTLQAREGAKAGDFHRAAIAACRAAEGKQPGEAAALHGQALDWLESSLADWWAVHAATEEQLAAGEGAAQETMDWLLKGWRRMHAEPAFDALRGSERSSSCSNGCRTPDPRIRTDA